MLDHYMVGPIGFVHSIGYYVIKRMHGSPSLSLTGLESGMGLTTFTQFYVVTSYYLNYSKEFYQLTEHTGAQVRGFSSVLQFGM